MRLQTGAAAICAALALAACTPAATSPDRSPRSDVVLQWNAQVLPTGGRQSQRTLAMVHVAMFDAINAITPRFTPYLQLPPPPPGASPEAAAAGAAHGILLRLFPAEEPTLAAALMRSLIEVPDGEGERDGVRYGDDVAAMLFVARAGDNILGPEVPFAFDSLPGSYQLTAPEPVQPVNTTAGTWRPFALESAGQFRPPDPPDLTSARYGTDVDEVRRLGGLQSADRTRDDEVVARWHTESGVVQFNRIARTEAATDGRDVLEHARLFALLNLALADSITSVFEAKYAYRRWRPVTAIRQAETDGNSGTTADVVWSPFLPTPAHPEYPSAHSVVQSAGTRVLTSYFGRSHGFVATSGTVAGVTRAYDSFEAFAEEGRRARILGGMHFRSAVEAGAIQGTKVADWVLEHQLRPLSIH